jgi:chloramphenicol 3-O phosphotransferase
MSENAESLTKSWQLEDISKPFCSYGIAKRKRDTRPGGSAVDLLVRPSSELTLMNDCRAPGKIILINGASSAGKSTLARSLQQQLPEPFLHWSFDHLRASNALPMARIRNGELDWASMRPAVFDGFHRCLPAFAKAGNNLIVDHIIEQEQWLADLVELLAPFDVFFVGLHCPLLELERRERQRGDRRHGEARRDFHTVNRFAKYDLDIDTTQPNEDNVARLIAAWQGRSRPTAFERMATHR